MKRQRAGSVTVELPRKLISFEIKARVKRRGVGVFSV